MKIFVADPLVPGQARVYEVEFDDNYSEIRHVLWIPLPRNLGFTDLDDFVREKTESWVVAIADIVVLGVHPNQRRNIQDDGVLDDFYSRFGQKPLFLIQHAMGKIVGSQVRGENLGVTFDVESSIFIHIREADVKAILRRPGALLPESDLAHYEGPNGNHYRSFIRVGIALRTIAELDRISFWLAPEILLHRPILVDHWAMIALAYHANAYVEEMISLDKVQTLSVEGGTDSRGWLVRVASLSEYDEDVEVIRQKILSMSEIENVNSLTLIVSVVSSGILAKRVIDTCEELGTEVRSIAVCTTGQQSVVVLDAVLCQMGHDSESIPASSCVECDNPQSTVIPIEKDTYLLGLSAFNRTTYVTADDARTAKEFFGTYGDVGISRVHKTHSNDGRHQAFYLDIGAILSHNVFQKKLKKLLHQINDQIDVVITPNEIVAAKLGALVSRSLSAPLISQDARSFDQLSTTDCTILLDSDRICFVDDSIITGKQILIFRNELIRFRRKHGRSGVFRMHCIIGVARPKSQTALQGIRDITRDDSYHLHCVEQIYLPNWNEERCPWCWELRQLKSIQSVLPNNAFIEARLLALEDTRSGLNAGLFISWSGQNQFAISEPIAKRQWPETSERYHWDSLNRESVFGDVQQAELMLSVASAIQSLRGKTKGASGSYENNSRLDDEFRTPIAKVLEPDLYFQGRYYEPVLTAAFLRAVGRHDVRSASGDATLGEMVRDHLILSPKSSELRGEIALALARRILPPSPSIDFQLLDPPGDPQTVSALIELMRTNTNLG
jgi:hypothetical protein